MAIAFGHRRKLARATTSASGCRATGPVARNGAVPGNRAGRPTAGTAALLGPSLLAAQNVPLSLPATSPPPDIRGIVPAQPYFLPGNYLWLIVAVVILVLAAWGLWRYLRRARTRPRAPLLTPREIAARRLRELERRADSLDPRIFGVEVSDVLRAYIGAQFGLHPERQTSPEFLNFIVGASVFSAAEKQLLGEFLEQADLLKFARQEAPLEARRGLLVQANDFVQPAPAVLSSSP
jgi:hypothetical protein